MRIVWLLCGLGLIGGLACDGGPGKTELGPGGDGGRDLVHDGRRDGPTQPTEARPPIEAGKLDGGAGECDGIGNKLRLTFYIKSLELTATDVQPVKSSKGVIGFTGVADSQRFWFGRYGAPDDGAFSEAKSYDASRPPFHMLLQLWPASSGSACQGNSACEIYYGVNGTWKIATTTAPTAGTYILSAITQQEGCWKDKPSGPPDISGCPIVGGTIYGCFKVN